MRTSAPARVRTPGAWIHANGGLLVWSLHFLVVYTGAALACEIGWGQGFLGLSANEAIVLVATAVALLALVLLAVLPAGHPVRRGDPETNVDRFLVWQTRAVAALSAAGTLYVAYAAVILGDTCR
jgi:hypothetical protein